jgi:hypothetical protein
MAISGWMLYVLVIALLILLYRRAPGLSLEAQLDAARREHEAVQRMLREHPQGGSSRQVRRWLSEEQGY